MKIQIGEMAFVFLLPQSDINDTSTSSRSPTNESFGYISTPCQLEKYVQNGADDNEDDEQKKSDGELSELSLYIHKDIKPPYSYASLITQAINSEKTKKMTLNGIYNFINTHYPYYQMTQNGWQVKPNG